MLIEPNPGVRPFTIHVTEVKVSGIVTMRGYHYYSTVFSGSCSTGHYWEELQCQEKMAEIVDLVVQFITIFC